MSNLPLFPDDFSSESQPSASQYSVTDLTAYIRRHLESDETLQDVWVEGEISNLTRAPSGHIYFTLKDANAQLKAVMWKMSAVRLHFTPQHGERVLANGKITVYEPRGEYQLVANILQPVGLGDLHRQFELLKAALAAEGLFDLDQKRPIPVFPRRIGIVTSPRAAAFQDVLNILRRRYPLAQVILSPTLVQGIDAPPLIIDALAKLYVRDDLDVILLVRGGGSLEDLWCFNDELLVRTVAASPIPIITGVGHEIDFTLVDFAADFRAPTPSAAAEVITQITVDDLRYTIDTWQQRALDAMQTRIDEQRQTLTTQRRSLRHLSPQSAISNRRQRVDELSLRLQRGIQKQLTALRQQLTVQQTILQTGNPLAVLARGYAIVRRAGDGKQITDAIHADSGTNLDIQLHRGSLRATVKDRKLATEPEKKL